ncbi:DUF1993 domain-containing protein [Sphingomonas ginkgonis]|uniref:DUF1993 domain-containing protein n=1 Tax=Sphingomonas ginkgonis TaxID=2315330 RepID=A0A3R9Z533_9SPHN|nr:DUF1993 domain-containing protein [Sphingomonas ginkgonis]RST29988.1 DUF1993 domain-containing protein [Sphingomonas ginkgonis]
MHLTALLVPSLVNPLAALAGWLDKGEAFAAARGESPDALLALRLAPDMWPLASQVRLAAFQSQESLHRLRGEPVPAAVDAIRQAGRDGGERPGTWAEARALVAETLALLRAVGPAEFDAGADAPLAHPLPMGMVFDMTGDSFVRDWAIPQVGFHVAMAYALLRQAGVPIGKIDYVPHMFAYVRPGTMPGAA